MGSSSPSGFQRLWDHVVISARQRIADRSPEDVQRFMDSVTDLESSAALAQKVGFGPTPLLKAIEAGAAYREALFRLSNANRAAELLRADSTRLGVLEAVVLDGLRIYLSAFIDATRKFVEAALGQLLPDDVDTRARRDEVRVWAAARKKTLSTGRETVAHADTAFIAGIEEEGLWTPMILLDLAQEDALVEMFRDGILRDHEKFDWRAGQLLKTAVLAIAQAEQQLGMTADLLERNAVPGG